MMEKEHFGAYIERGTITAEENGKYRVQSLTRYGIVTPPLAALHSTETYAIDDMVFYFLFPDGDGRILSKL